MVRVNLVLLMHMCWMWSLDFEGQEFKPIFRVTREAAHQKMCLSLWQGSSSGQERKETRNAKSKLSSGLSPELQRKLHVLNRRQKTEGFPSSAFAQFLFGCSKLLAGISQSWSIWDNATIKKKSKSIDKMRFLCRKRVYKITQKG